MIAAGRAVDDRRRAPRVALFAAIGAAHLYAILLMLQPSTATPIEEPAALAVFDIVVPPPRSPPPPPPPPPTAKPRQLRIASAAPPSGGSPGSRREPPARRTAIVAPPAREALDATLAPLARDALPLPAAGSAVVALGLGGIDGTGTGSGAGSGPGSGDARGAGGDGLDRYARAEWIRQPTQASWQRFWPTGQKKRAEPVAILLSCRVGRDGRPFDCQIRSETPAGMGFGSAAMAAMAEARVRPVARNGTTLWELPVLIPVTFEGIRQTSKLSASAAASAPRAR